MSELSPPDADKLAEMNAGRTSNRVLFRCPDCGTERWINHVMSPRPMCPECFDGFDTPNTRMVRP